MTILPIVHVALCRIAQTAVLISQPIRYTTRVGTVPESTEADIIVTLVGALGTHHMVWRESPAAWEGPPATAIHHVQTDDIGGLVRDVLDECVPAWSLTDDLALSSVVDGAVKTLGATGGLISNELQRTIIGACRAAIRDTDTDTGADTSIEMRADGLSCETACRTIEYVASQHGATTERRGWTVVSRDAVPRAAADQIAAIMALHGFAMAISDNGDGLVTFTIDATTCPPGDDLAGERKRLADDLAERVEREVGASKDDWRAVERAADNEFRWCLAQTLPFLRDRAGRRAPAATSGTTPA